MYWLAKSSNSLKTTGSSSISSKLSSSDISWSGFDGEGFGGVYGIGFGTDCMSDFTSVK